MASIRQRKNKWQARITSKGFPPEVQTFDTKLEALKWAREIESSMDSGAYQNQSIANDQTLHAVLQRYMEEVTPTKRGAKREAEGIRFMQRHKMVQYSMAKLTPAVIASYRDERLKTVSAGTIIRELSILSGIITHARKEWALPIANPCALVRKPSSPRSKPTANGRRGTEITRRTQTCTQT